MRQSNAVVLPSNNVFRLLLKEPRWCSGSKLLVSHNVASFRFLVVCLRHVPEGDREATVCIVPALGDGGCTATDVAWNMTWLHYRKTNKQRCSETYRQTDRRRDRRTEHSAWHDARWIDRRNQWYFSYKPISVSVTFQISHFYLFGTS